jgi:anti-sigma-K factor RskA
MDQNKKLFHKEIRFRMESDAWNLSMARRVMDRNLLQNKRIMKIWSMASLATAAMAFIVFMSGIYSAARKYSPDISSGSVYSYAYFENSSNLDNDIIAARVELLINEAYPMR